MLYKNKYGYIAFNVSNSKYRECRPNDLLYWEMLKWSIKKGIQYVDLGQIEKETSDKRALGLYKFKRKWLGTVYDRIYFYRNQGNKTKEGEKKDKLKKLRKIWSNLPLFLIKKIGPEIASQLAI